MSQRSDARKNQVKLDARVAGEVSAQAKLRDLRCVTHDAVQDAINVWDELWAELDGQGDAEETVSPEAGFEPACGWTDFLKKMWVLRHHLDFTQRVSRDRFHEMPLVAQNPGAGAAEVNDTVDQE